MKDTTKTAVVLLAATGGIGLAASSAAAQNTRPAIDASAIVSPADTFAILIGDEQVGTQVVSIRRLDGGYAFREETQTPIGSQITVVSMSSDLTMQTVQQEGTMAGQEMVIDVRYDGEWVEGRALIPRREGVEEVEVRSTVPWDVVDDNVLIGLLPGLNLQLDERFRISVFQSGRNRLVEYVLTVQDAGSVTVPAGSYPALRVEATDGESSIVFLVRARPPHRVLAVEPPGGPLRLVRLGPG